MHHPTRAGLSRLYFRGQCLCGEVRYAAAGPAGGMWYCHCTSCAKASGVGFGTWIEVPGVRWESAGARRTCVAVPAALVRSYCATCGTQLPAERRDGSAALLPAGGLDSNPGLRPGWHAFTALRSPWLPAWASLPNYAGPPDHGHPGAAASRPGPTPSHPPELPVHGSCLCGTISYAVESPLHAMRACHCSRCRRRSGSSYLVALACPASGLRFLSGEASARRWQLPGAPRYIVRFCGDCGASIPSTIGNGAYITAGSLDSDPGIRTRCHIYFGSRADWIDAEDDLPHFEEQPPQDFDWSRDSGPG